MFRSRLRAAFLVALVALASGACGDDDGQPSRQALIDEYVSALNKSDAKQIKALLRSDLKDDSVIQRRIDDHGGPDWKLIDVNTARAGEIDLYELRLTFRSNTGAEVVDTVGAEDTDPTDDESWYLILGRSDIEMPQPLDTTP